MTRPSIQFWFEFASTYSYLAAMRVEDTAAKAGVGVDWKSFLLGPIFAAQGWNDSPFNIYPAKGAYMWRDMERGCARHALEWRRPTRFPRGALLAARIACVGSREPWCPDFVRAVYRANFAEDREIGEPTVVGEILTGLGLPAATLIEQAQSPEAKDRLRRQNDEAAGLGIFGAPSFVADGELFWGNDRLEEAIAWAKRGSA
jgi:2-hydroxychromene-2-carboxylate isomerase